MKVDVCNRVRDWCVINNKKQNPTFSAHVNGNMPIAKTKRKVILEANLQAVTKPVVDRLKDMRSVELISTSNYSLLKESSDGIFDALKTKTAGIEYYGVSLNVDKPIAANYIIPFLKQKIVIKMRGQKTLHLIELEREFETLSALQKAIGKEPREYTKYYLTQPYEMPACFILASTVTDGFVPTSSIFFYICPLQASIALLYGYYFSSSFHAEDTEIDTYNLQLKNYSVKDFRNNKYLEIIDHLVDRFGLEMEKQIVARLDHLDRELKNISD